jgi:hypothetical protein
MNQPANIQGLLAAIRGSDAPTPELRDFREKLCVLLETGVRPAGDSSWGYKEWAMIHDAGMQAAKTSARALPPGSLQQEFLRIFPILHQLRNIDALRFGAIAYQRFGEEMLSQAEKHYKTLSENRLGTDTHKLLKKLTVGLDLSQRKKALSALRETLTTLAAVDTAVSTDTLTAEGDMPEIQWLCESVRCLGSLYEHGGKPVLELLEELLKLNSIDFKRYQSQVKGEPDSNHKQIIRALADRMPACNLGKFAPRWRHWRNAHSHVGGITPEKTADGWAVRIIDKNQNGKETYNELFDRVGVFVNMADCFDLLYGLGAAYGLAANAVLHEIEFDTMRESDVAPHISALIKWLHDSTS